MKWKLLCISTLFYFFSVSALWSDTLISNAQMMKLKKNLNEIKNQQTSLQFQLVSSQQDLKIAEKKLSESNRINLELQNELLTLQSQSMKLENEAKTLSNSLTNALKYSQKQRKRAGRAEAVAVILVGILLAK